MSKTATATHARNDRRTVWYTPEERARIDPYKAQYVRAASPDERKRIARFHILPSIFNFWIKKGIAVEETRQIRTQVLQ